MKKIYHLFYVLILLANTGCLKTNKSDPWGQLDSLLSKVTRPIFPDREFNVLMYGGIGDGKRDNSDALRKAIEDCHAAGGGRVVIPEGSFVSGPIYLKSNVNLHLKRGATLFFSKGHASLIHAFKEKNIAITGEGTLDARANSAQLVQANNCENVIIEGLKINYSKIHWMMCINVSITDVISDSTGFISESSTNVWIKDCDFDSIAIKAGENIIIQNCKIINETTIASKIENVFIENCKMNNLLSDYIHSRNNEAGAKERKDKNSE